MRQLSSEQWHILRRCLRLSATDKWIYQCLLDLHTDRTKALTYTTVGIGSYAGVPDHLVSQSLANLNREKFLLVTKPESHPSLFNEWWSIQPLFILEEEKEEDATI